MLKELKEFNVRHYALAISSLTSIFVAGAGIVCLFYNNVFVELPLSKVLLLSAIPTLPLCIVNFIFATISENEKKPNPAMNWISGAFMTSVFLFFPLFLAFVFKWSLNKFIWWVILEEFLFGVISVLKGRATEKK